jgi:crotonobetainyl-CoA:carnitine CoA-transferase CaiB-like acyl-CoA transferase
MPIANFPVALSDTPGEIRGPAPTLGSDVDDILAELGFGADRIAGFRALKVV